MKRLIALAFGGTALFVGALPAGAAADRDTQPMRWHMQTGLPHGTPVADGAVARLVRTENGISYSVTTEMLQPGHAYTVWVVVVNNPGACGASPCSPADILTNPATDAQVTYGTGHVVGMSGRSGFGGSLRRGRSRKAGSPTRASTIRKAPRCTSSSTTTDRRSTATCRSRSTPTGQGARTRVCRRSFPPPRRPTARPARTPAA